ncbi:MAG: hypothetical protein KKD69_06230 [Euryarchaeota archaeon]|nr:hypothetical protein [Euryarchaeota archaeon]MCG2727796.1 hypothetical protein [Candidatus Methanoperedenaceae archaeon]
MEWRGRLLWLALETAGSPNKEERLPALPLLRTLRATFTAYGSSLLSPFKSGSAGTSTPYKSI